MSFNVLRISVFQKGKPEGAGRAVEGLATTVTF
jgi:hypothetical protein